MSFSIVFATNNINKIREIEQMISSDLKLISLKAIGCFEDIPETSPTIEGNAIQKARYVYEKYGKDCFAEDTGLEIKSLNNEPGVYTARYAGPEKDPEANMALALKNLEGKTDRSARFKTVIALVLGGKVHTFEGIAQGSIAFQKQGTGGFGYDPIFIPEGKNCSFAEMTEAEKNQISHRAKATYKLKLFLNQLGNDG